MKIALLSFHNAANFGAALQAYALQYALEQRKYDCEYINYYSYERANYYRISFLIWDSFKKKNISSAIKYILGSPFLVARKKKFNSFYLNYLHTTKRIYRNSQEAAILNNQYDRFIVGSDQVWNPHNNGNDTAYLLDFVEDSSKKISYASSFGLSELDDDLKERYRKCFLTFHALSVREKMGQRIVEELTGRTPELVLDPVMLLTMQDWRTLASGVKNPQEEYIFTYTNRDQQINSFMKTGYHLDHRKIYKLSRFTKPNDFMDSSIRVKYWMSPLEFVSVIDHAELVVSASFHCLAMAILLNKPFVVILTGNEGKDERLNNLLRMFHLEDRALNDTMTEEDILKPIDWDFVNKEIIKKREESLQYLLNAIG